MSLLPTQEVGVLISGQRTRSYVPQLRVCMLQWRQKVLHAATKTQHSQINTEIKKQKHLLFHLNWLVRNVFALRHYFPDSSVGKESAYNARDHGLILVWGRSSREGIGYPLQYSWASLCGSAGKESTCNVGDLGSIPGLGRSPGEGKGYPLQCSGLENSMDCIVHEVTKSWTQLSHFHFHHFNSFFLH